MKKLLIILLVLFSANTFSQELKRRASLGIRMQNMNDSLQKITGYDQNNGAYIDLVLPNSTVDKAGMKPGAVLLQINDQKILNIRDIGPAAGNLRDQDPVKLTYFQNGKTINKTVKAIGRPEEEISEAVMLYDVVELNGLRLRSILATPKGIENPPVVYFIQGYTCSSTEFSMVPDISTMQLYSDWIAAGYAVYRIEKAGVGDSEGDKHCMEMNFTEELEIFRQGYKALQQYPQINKERIFLFGHSMGGVVAPLLAKEFQPFGVMTYGTLINSWFEYMQELTRVQGEMFHTPYAEIEGDIRRVTPFWYEYFILQKSNEELLSNEKIYEMLEEEGTLQDFKNGIFMQRHYTFWQDLQQVSLVNTWLEVKSHVLAIYGEYDIQALNSNHVQTIANIVNTNNPEKGSWAVIEKADHGFVTFNSMDENVQTLNSGNYFQALRTKYNPNIAKESIKWMDGLK
ncbi:MAG: alpha/beta hydrolase [Crocinitomicaceae bacterium]|nr:alpha/beta hydrolase [Crocinitomicaceae bacterium]